MSKFQAISKWKLSFYKIIFIIFCDASQDISLGSCLCGRWKNVWNRRLATGRVLISRTLCSSQVESWLKAPQIQIYLLPVPSGLNGFYQIYRLWLLKYTCWRFPVVWVAESGRPRSHDSTRARCRCYSLWRCEKMKIRNNDDGGFTTDMVHG